MRANRFLSISSLGFCAFLITGCPGDDSPPGDPPNGSTGTGTGTTSGGPTPTTAMASTGEDPSTSTTTSGGDTTGAESSGSSDTGPGGALPDIDMSVVLEQTIESVFTDTAMFQKNACEVVDMCLLGSGERRLLHFDTITPNLGDADFYVGNPKNNPKVFGVNCTGQSVYLDYANYRLLSADGVEEVAVGHKAAFALIDVAPWTDDAGPAQYGFGDDMGISVGWVDIYNAGLPCQYVDITGVASGDYLLEIHINASQAIEESDYDNNLLLVPVTITDEDTGGAPDGWNCDPGFYDTNDGCDCGCGLFDPDCADMTVESCEFCANAGSCAMSCMQIDPLDNSTCV